MARYFYLKDKKPVLATHSITLTHKLAKDFSEELDKFHYHLRDIYCYSISEFEFAEEIVKKFDVEYTTTELEWPKEITDLISTKTYQTEEEVANDLIYIEGELEAEVGQEFHFTIIAPRFMDDGKLKVIMSVYDSINDIWRDNMPTEYTLEEDGSTEIKLNFGREGQYKFTIESNDINTTDVYSITIKPSSIPTPEPEPIPDNSELAAILSGLQRDLSHYTQRQLTADEIYKQANLEKISIEELKILKTNQLNYFCNTTILNGFTSDALGPIHKYDLDYEAQINMSGIMNALTAGLVGTTIDWKTDKGSLPHTADQMRKVYMDGLAFKQYQISKYWAMKMTIDKLQTKEEIILINWE